MITNVLYGGLGNQLFQIAAGFAHSKRMKTEYALNYNFSLNKKFVGQGHSPEKYKDNFFSKIPETKKEQKIHNLIHFQTSKCPRRFKICFWKEHKCLIFIFSDEAIARWFFIKITL